MTLPYLANAVAVGAVVWALWVRRDTFHSRWDAPITAGAALYGLGAVLDTPWPQAASLSFAITGKYFLLSTLGHISYLVGSAVGLKSVYIRLLPDDAIGPFMRTRVFPLVYAAAGIMLVSVIASPVTATMAADHLNLITPDGWLTLYFATYYLTMSLLMGLAIYGGLQLRCDESHGVVDALIGVAVVGTLSCLATLTAVLTGRTSFVIEVAWPVAYAATTAAALICALSWRRRTSLLQERRHRLRHTEISDEPVG